MSSSPGIAKTPYELLTSINWVTGPYLNRDQVFSSQQFVAKAPRP